jgi:ABC-2 type transport system permease protein
VNRSKNILHKIANYLSLALAYIRLNWLSHIEYRSAFYIEATGMFFNNLLWLAFWVYFFKAFPSVPSWTGEDIITLWAIASAGWGLAFVLFGNCRLLASMIAKGELDSWMLYPRHLLSHLILGKMKASAFGDMVFGFLVYILFVKPDLAHMLLFIILTVSIAVLFSAFSILMGSLSFFLGNAESLAAHCEIALITFSTYPSPLFEGKVRILLCTLIPALFVSYYPIEALRTLSLVSALYAIAGALGLSLISIVVFYWGLKRYESGNLTAMRG